ncbi:MAG: helix-turn-helix transcriptional regulator [Rhizobiales bacterium]|nr:helix-turn-helix transcriptional regulator [Hyphomicrobiales bacterium]
MLVVDLAAAASRLPPGERAFSRGKTTFTRMGGGEGGFQFDRLTLGLVLFDLPSHATSHGDGARRRLPLRAGQGWVFPAGMEGWCAWENDTAFLNVQIESALMTEAGLAEPGHLRPHVGEIDPLAVQMALALHQAGESAPALYREGLGAALAGQLATTFSASREVAASLIDPRISRAIEAMKAQLAEDISLDDLAAIAAMSPFHFARQFKQATGRSPYKFLTELRIERAKVLLKTTTLPVTEIAFRVGWENASHFAAAFRQNVGTSAGAFRAG